MQLKWYACLHKEQIFILEWLKTLDSHIEHLAIIDTNMKNFPFIQLGFELTTFHVYYIQSKKYLDIQYNNSASGAEKISAILWKVIADDLLRHNYSAKCRSVYTATSVS